MIQPLQHDFSALRKLDFDYAPVGVKFEYFKPENIDRLDIQLAMCEMVREAQKRDKPFYMDKDNENCMGTGAMGMETGPEPTWAAAGLIGERMNIFKDAGANMRCMTNYTTFNAGAVNYVAFANLDVLDFEPDLMVFSGSMAQVEPVLRSIAYSTGLPYESKSTPVFQCSWLYSYPALTGKMNFIVMGSGHGTTARETYESGSILVAIPSPLFATMLENLEIMEIVPHAWQIGRDAWLEEEEGIYGKLVGDSIANDEVRAADEAARRA